MPRTCPGYLRSVADLGASLVALDDGSSDATAELLRADPRVLAVLPATDPDGDRRWDDAANRQALLDHAAGTEFDWLLFLDVDERIDADDAAALRGFLATDAVPGLAYGLQLHRTWGDRADPEPRYVYRLFSRRPEMTLPAERLHANPVPVEIARRAWVRTSIRVRHLESAERLRRRRAKYEHADPEGAHRTDTETMLEPAPERLVAWPPRSGKVAIVGGTKAPPAAGEADGSRPLLVCLLAVRNGAAELADYLESAERFADAVIALDDGSSDATAELLAASSLVAEVIRNPARDSYAGWDDAANRQALVDACAELGPRWAVFLDADERIDPDDAAALREFAAGEAVPGEAYGFRVHRMIGSLDRYDRAELWVYRMFAPEPGMRIPAAERLHFVPVPEEIPRTRWRQTTVRIQHLAGLDEQRRRSRLLKYEQADPDRRWQADYERLLEARPARPWVARPPGLPVLLAPGRGASRVSGDDLDFGAPLLSAIVISHDDETRIERTVRSVVEQECEQPFEVIVAVSGTDRTAAVVAERFPQVTLIDLGERALPGRARNAGVAAARGDYISFPGSHVELPPGSLAARIGAHEAGWPMVTGSIVNGNLTRSGWAAYFLDHSSSLPGRPSGELAAAPAHCSYVRQFVLEAGGFPEDIRAGEDTVVNQALWRRGHRAYREREIRLIHRSPCTNPIRLVRHHFVRGRALARILRPAPGAPRSRRFLRGYARRRLDATDRRLADWGGELAPRYRSVRRLVKLGIAAAHAGALYEWTFGRSSPAGSTRSEQPGDRDQPEAEVPQTVDDGGQGLDGRGAVGPVVKQHDRAG